MGKSKSNEVSVQLEDIMKLVADGAVDAGRSAIGSTARDAVQKLRNTSPRRSGDYAAGWAVRKHKDWLIVVYNKVYQLTHLLENGHISANQYGEYGRVPAHPHIKPVEEWASEELPRRVMENLNDNL